MTRAMCVWLALFTLALAACAPVEQNIAGQDTIMTAARRGDQREVQKMLQAGINPDATDAQGRTALHHAALGGHINVITQLIDAGANVNIEDAQGKTPLQLAHEAGFEAAAEALALRGGA